MKVSPFQEPQLRCILRIREIQDAIRRGPTRASLKNLLAEETAALWQLTHRLIRTAIRTCLSRRVARSYRSSPKGESVSTEDDYVHEGAVTLMRCVDGYDEQNGTLFSTYLTTAVRNRMNYLLTMDSPLKMSETVLGRIQRATQAFISAHGRDPDPDELEDYGITGEDLEFVSNARRLRSVPGHSSSDEQDPEFYDHLEQRRERRPDDVAAQKDAVSRIVDLVRLLRTVHVHAPAIVRARLGIDPGGSLTGSTLSFENIGKIIGVNADSVERIYKLALRKLQERMGVEEPASSRLSRP